MTRIMCSLVTTKIMKKLILTIGLIALAGCSTSQQRNTYNTLATTEATATAAVDGYFLAAAKGLAPTNGIPRVSKTYNEFQSVMNVSMILAQNNSNALATSNVLQELSAVVSAVAEFAPSKTVTLTP